MLTNDVVSFEQPGPDLLLLVNSGIFLIWFLCPTSEKLGVYWFGPVRQSICPSVCNTLAAENLKNPLC